MESTQSILAAISSARKKSGRSWKEICGKCGVSYKTVYNWLDGRHEPVLDGLLLIMHELGMELRAEMPK